MLSPRLLRLIETHAHELANSLLQQVENSEFTRDYHKVPASELRQRVFEVYHHLSEWLLEHDATEVERRYLEIGARRAHQGVPLSQLMWALVLTKQNLWRFARNESVLDQPLEMFGALELLQLLESFFDRATHAAALGYERAGAKHVEPGTAHSDSLLTAHARSR